MENSIDRQIKAKIHRFTRIHSRHPKTLKLGITDYHRLVTHCEGILALAREKTGEAGPLVEFMKMDIDVLAEDRLIMVNDDPVTKRVAEKKTSPKKKPVPKKSKTVSNE